MGARETALNALIACRKDGAWSNSVLKTYTIRDGLDRREAALASRLCYGVLQNRGKLDFYLKQLLTGKLKDLHPVVHDILHLGLYQLFEMDKIPESAAVNESVTLAKKYCRKQRFAPGLVNAVLRGAVRQKDTLKQPTRLEDRYSHPEKLVKLLRENVGDKLELMLQANNEAPDMVIQTNTLKISTQELVKRLEEEGVSVKNHPWMIDCLVLADTGRLEQLPAFQEGLFYVQDAAAKLAVLCAQLPKDAKVLDCCAAPGGKSFAAAIAMGGTGHITSCDVHEHKISLIDGGAKRLGMDNITAGVQDASQCREEWLEGMDAVIADVPCSGYGIIRKKPDIRYKKQEDADGLPKIQLQILLNALDYLKPGGRVVYSTCTVLEEENQCVLREALAIRKDCELEEFVLPGIGQVNGAITLWPQTHGTDGFFLARIKKKGG